MWNENIKEENNIKKIRFSDFFEWQKLKSYFNYKNELKKNPKRVALSISLGLFIGLFIPIGFQTIIIFPLGLFMEVNLAIAYLMTFVSNPVTAVPLYYGMFKLGESLTNYHVSFSMVEKFINSPSWLSFTQIGGTALINYGIGALISAVVISTISYSLLIIIGKKMGAN